MKRSIISLMGCYMLWIACNNQQVRQTTQTDEQTFRKTFSAFQQAVKANDREKVRKFIHFPLQTAPQWTNDDRPDKKAGLVTADTFTEYYPLIFHPDVRRLLPGAGEEELNEIDAPAEDYYKTIRAGTDSGSRLYEVYLQYPEPGTHAESYFAVVFGQFSGEYKAVAYYGKWPVVDK
ncbi:hypothetical protein ACWKWU_13825 [Chitinophaga lutea]